MLTEAGSVADGEQPTGEPGDHAPASSAFEPRGPAWAFGSGLAMRNVEAGRRAYRRLAEAAEYTLNASETTTARARGDLRAMAVGTRETVLHLSERGFAAAREMRGRWLEIDERGFDALEAGVARARADFRDIALAGQVAADTNVKACFDCVEDLAHAPTARDFVAVQSSFVVDQCQRSLRQMLDLQRMALDMWRKAAFVRAG